MPTKDDSEPIGTELKKHSGDSWTVRLGLPDRHRIVSVIEELIESLGATVIDTDMVGFEGPLVMDTESLSYEGERQIHDITFTVESQAKVNEILKALEAHDGVNVINCSDRTFRMHLGGKIEVTPRVSVETRDDLSRVYTPGVAQVCLAIKDDKTKARNLTMKGTTIAIITDGSRVLSLGDIGPEASLPVMEGKAVLFKRFGGVNALPLALGTQDTEEIIRICTALAPTFGGFNLEDIGSPRCWEIERRLKETLKIPVFHDDQHGTAVVVLAATLNACKVVRKRLRDLRIVVSGVGAAGMACIKLLMAAGARHIIGFNKDGAIYKGRPDLSNDEERWLADNSNEKGYKGTLRACLKGKDMFLGLSAPDVIEAKDLIGMRRDPIVFPLANPKGEVPVKEAQKYATVVQDGTRVNNALAFPGIFKGALQARAEQITEEMKMAAAYALAGVIPDKKLRADNILPAIYKDEAHLAVAAAVRQVAYATGQARRRHRK